MSSRTATTTTKLKDQIDIALLYDEIISLAETYKVSEMYPVFLAFINQYLGRLPVDDLEDMKTFLFNLIEEIDGTIEVSQSRPATTRE